MIDDYTADTPYQMAFDFTSMTCLRHSPLFDLDQLADLFIDVFGIIVSACAGFTITTPDGEHIA